MIKKIKRFLDICNADKLNQEDKVFCISMQRTGTTSTGKFFRDHGLRSIGWGGDRRNGWSKSWFNNDFKKIFESKDFKISNAYEDSPWWFPGFYKTLYEKFPNAKFVLLKRDPEKWFKSMKSHSGGNVVGAMERHCKIYNRQEEVQELIKNEKITSDDLENYKGEKLLKINDTHKDHYISCYLKHFEDANSFFEKTSKGSLISGDLEDPNKWEKIGKFLNINVKDTYDIHTNQSNR